MNAKPFDVSLLGLTREQIRERLGDPDDVGGTSRRYSTPCIWLYGSTEIYFDRTTGLVSMIFDDDEKGGTGKSLP